MCNMASRLKQYIDWHVPEAHTCNKIGSFIENSHNARCRQQCQSTLCMNTSLNNSLLFENPIKQQNKMTETKQAKQAKQAKQGK